MRERCRFTVIVTCLLCTAAVSGCAGVQRLDRTSIPTLTVAELRASKQDPAWLLKAMGSRGVVVRVRAGEELPVRLGSSIGFATLRAGDNRLRFDREVWLYLARKKVLLSPDGRRWVGLGDWRAMKRVFDMRRGTVQVGFGVKRGQGAVITLGVHARAGR